MPEEGPGEGGWQLIEEREIPGKRWNQKQAAAIGEAEQGVTVHDCEIRASTE